MGELFTFWPGDVDRFYNACLDKYPTKKTEIKKAFTDLKNYRWHSDEKENKQMMLRMRKKEKMLEQYTKKVKNIPLS